MQKINVAIIRQGLYCCFQTGLLDLEEWERLLAETVWMEFRLVMANGACHDVCGRNYIRVIASDKLKRFRYETAASSGAQLYTKKVAFL